MKVFRSREILINKKDFELFLHEANGPIISSIFTLKYLNNFLISRHLHIFNGQLSSLALDKTVLVRGAGIIGLPANTYVRRDIGHSSC